MYRYIVYYTVNVKWSHIRMTLHYMLAKHSTKAQQRTSITITRENNFSEAAVLQLRNELYRRSYSLEGYTTDYCVHFKTAGSLHEPAKWNS